jgi:hypothetical protein
MQETRPHTQSWEQEGRTNSPVHTSRTPPAQLYIHVQYAAIHTHLSGAWDTHTLWILPKKCYTVLFTCQPTGSAGTFLLGLYTSLCVHLGPQRRRKRLGDSHFYQTPRPLHTSQAGYTLTSSFSCILDESSSLFSTWGRERGERETGKEGER